MATVTMDIPNDKVQMFLSMLVENGFNKPGNFLKSQVQHLQSLVKNDKRNVHPYYDWDFFHNELEFE
jgi:hypothetical protein